MKRVGTNYSDRNAIRAYVEAGETNAERIANNLNLTVPPVQGYIDSLAQPPAEDPVENLTGEDLPPPTRRKRAVAEN